MSRPIPIKTVAYKIALIQCMYLDVSSTCHGSKKECYVMAEKTDHDSSAHSNPDHYITQTVNDSELKLVSLQNETSRQSKTAM